MLNLANPTHETVACLLGHLRGIRQIASLVLKDRRVSCRLVEQNSKKVEDLIRDFWPKDSVSWQGISQNVSLNRDDIHYLRTVLSMRRVQDVDEAFPTIVSEMRQAEETLFQKYMAPAVATNFMLEIAQKFIDPDYTIGPNPIAACEFEPNVSSFLKSREGMALFNPVTSFADPHLSFSVALIFDGWRCVEGGHWTGKNKAFFIRISERKELKEKSVYAQGFGYLTLPENRRGWKISAALNTGQTRHLLKVGTGHAKPWTDFQKLAMQVPYRDQILAKEIAQLYG